MRILWLPHHHWEFIRRGQREYRFSHAIKDVHDVHVATWLAVREQPARMLSALRRRKWTEEGLTIHQTPRVPNVFGQRVHEATTRGLRINEILHRREVRRIVRRERIDLVIAGISHQSVGLPPHDLPVPVVFDYLDFKLEKWPEVEAEYMEIADAVLCTSTVLHERAARLHPQVFYLPNGVDLAAAGIANGDEVRRRYDLDGATVVSLIGVTASTDVFYVDAMAEAAREIPNLVFLLVGGHDELANSMLRRARELELRTVAPGAIAPAEIADFFAATDVGLYPGDQNAYFDAACPLKVLEYSAAGKRVVATDLAELRSWGFANLHLAAPSAEAFARALVDAARATTPRPPDLERFDWPVLSNRLLEILDAVVDRGKIRS